MFYPDFSQIFDPQAVFWGASLAAITRGECDGSDTANSPLHLSIDFYLLNDSHCPFWGTKSPSALCLLHLPPSLPGDSFPQVTLGWLLSWGSGTGVTGAEAALPLALALLKTAV